jgi:hypothetical protein
MSDKFIQINEGICLEVKYNGELLGSVKAQYDLSNVPEYLQGLVYNSLAVKKVLYLSRGIMDPEYNDRVRRFNQSYEIWFGLSWWQKLIEEIKSWIGKPSQKPKPFKE